MTESGWLQYLDVAKSAGVLMMLPMMFMLYRHISTQNKAKTSEGTVYDLLKAEVERQSEVIKSLSAKVDQQRQECAEELAKNNAELAKNDAEILKLRAEIAELTSRLADRDRLDQMGREGKIERRKERLGAGRETV